MTNHTNFYDRFCKIKSRENETQKHEDEINNRIRDLQKEEILASLKTYGVPKERVETNGYSFQFDFNGMLIAFAVQTERICGEMHRLPQNREERILLANKDFILSCKELKAEFCQVFLYREFLINGDPASVIKDIITMAANPLAPFFIEPAADGKNQGNSQ